MGGGMIGMYGGGGGMLCGGCFYGDCGMHGGNGMQSESGMHYVFGMQVCVGGGMGFGDNS
jgi:hypothetical protein